MMEAGILIRIGGAMVAAAIYMMLLASTVAGKISHTDDASYSDACRQDYSGASVPAFVVAAYVGKEGKNAVLNLRWSVLFHALAFIMAVVCPPAYFKFTYPFLIAYAFILFTFTHTPNLIPATAAILSSSSYAYDFRFNLLFLAIKPFKHLIGTLLLSTTTTQVDDVVIILWSFNTLFLFISLLFCMFSSVKLHVTEGDRPDVGTVFLLRISYAQPMLLLLAASFVLIFFFIPTTYPYQLIAPHLIIAPCLSYWPIPLQNCLHRNLLRLSASITAFLTFTFNASTPPSDATIVVVEENPPVIP